MAYRPGKNRGGKTHPLMCKTSKTTTREAHPGPELHALRCIGLQYNANNSQLQLCCRLFFYWRLYRRQLIFKNLLLQRKYR